MSLSAAPHSLRRAATAALLGSVILAGCADRLDHFGKPPSLSPIGGPEKVAQEAPVVMPMPKPPETTRQPGSLWQAGAKTFFRDQRARQVGDVLTVTVEIDDKATMDNKTTRSRDNQDNIGLPNLLGFESKLGSVLPEAVNPAKLVGTSGKSTTSGNGQIDRKEKVNLKLAAIIRYVLPNGNFQIQGRQEIRVNAELRELLVEGVIRPEDIKSDNSIPYDKIAEARISYGGRGHLNDVQQPRWGQQVLEIVAPF